jgi:hypothetical protein
MAMRERLMEIDTEEDEDRQSWLPQPDQQEEGDDCGTEPGGRTCVLLLDGRGFMCMPVFMCSYSCV